MPLRVEDGDYPLNLINLIVKSGHAGEAVPNLGDAAGAERDGDARGDKESQAAAAGRLLSPSLEEESRSKDKQKLF